MLDFVFKDEITDLQRAEILIAARMEDLKRTGQSTQELMSMISTTLTMKMT
jgi:hypothetical protein